MFFCLLHVHDAHCAYIDDKAIVCDEVKHIDRGTAACASHRMLIPIHLSLSTVYEFYWHQQSACLITEVLTYDHVAVHCMLQ